MKKTFLLLLLFTAIPEADAKDFWRKTAQVLLGGVQISSPAAEQFGVKIPSPDTITITNGTPFHLILGIYDAEALAYLGPGDSLHHEEFWEPLTPDIPVVARFYRNCEKGEGGTTDCNDYVGALGRIFRIGGPGGQAHSWLIRLQEIRTPNGQYLYGGYAGGAIYPQPSVAPGYRRIEIRRRWWNAQASTHVLNNTLYTMSVIANGRLVATLDPEGGFTYFDPHAFAPRGYAITLHFTFTDQGRLVGAAERHIQVPGQGVRAYQFIVGPFDIQR